MARSVKRSGKRVDRINDLIDSGKKCMLSVDGLDVYGCDVCCTCKWFNGLTSECCLTDGDVRMTAPLYFGDESEGIAKGYYDNKTIIKNPAFYRCFVWREKDG